VIACEPQEAQLLGGAEWKPHKVQGWTPDFVPAVLDKSVADERLPISDAAAISCARELAQKEGLFVGISAGGTFAGALEVAKKAESGSVILAMMPDTGERYLSTVLFEGVNEGSDPNPRSGQTARGRNQPVAGTNRRRHERKAMALIVVVDAPRHHRELDHRAGQVRRRAQHRADADAQELDRVRAAGAR